MAFNDKEQEIINVGLKSGKTPDQIKQAVINYRTGVVPGLQKQQEAVPSQQPSAGIFQPAVDSIKGLGQTYSNFPGKIAEDVRGGGEQFNQGQQMVNKNGLITGKGVATSAGGLLKTAFRVAGDSAEAIYAPITAAVGATGLGKVFSAIGELSQKGKYNPINAITDLKSVQDFVEANPNLEEDFTRGLTLAFSALDKGKIEPSTVIKRTIEQFTPKAAPRVTVGNGTPTGELDANGIPKPPQTITVGGKEITHAMLQDPAISQTLKRTLSQVEQEALARFDSLNTNYKMVLRTAGTPDFADMLSGYKADVAAAQKLGFSVLAGTDGKPLSVEKIAQQNGQLQLSPADAAAGAKVSGRQGLTESVVGDVLPSTERIVNSQVSKALDLTQGDLKNINLSTGNDVGKFIADNNAIGVNKAEVVKNLTKVFDDNYKGVRTEINNVKATYNQVEIPRYTEALKELKKKVEGVAGQQEATAEINMLLDKKNPTLADAQRVKELVDEQFSLYNAMGDVKEGVAKSGLANIRKDLKEWIEVEVKDRSGVDIRDMNNKVQTSREILDAIEMRDTRGLTRSNFSISDIGLGATVGFGINPLVGAAAVLVKKIVESPSVRLRVVKFLDELNDAKKQQIIDDLEAGKAPDDLVSIINQDSSSNRSSELKKSKKA